MIGRLSHPMLSGCEEKRPWISQARSRRIGTSICLILFLQCLCTRCLAASCSVLWWTRTRRTYIWRFFCRITDPVVAVVATVTPKVTPPVVLWLFGFVWLFWLRVALHYTLLLLNLAPRVVGAAS